MSEATVIIPTHNHGPLLYHSVATALGQTVSDVEVFIIGDGVTDETRGVVEDLMKDTRVRFFDHPKSERTGEIYRHRALAEACGDIVCYLADDDLWLSNHVEKMLSLLSNANFANAPYFLVDDQGVLRAPLTGNLQLSFFRDRITAGTNHIPLSCAAHTLEFYRHLPFGWRTTPAKIATDLYMWQQFLSHPMCRPVTSTLPTALNFPSPMRKDWPIEQRMSELQTWRNRINQSEFLLLALESSIRDRAFEESRSEERAANAEAYAQRVVDWYAPQPGFDASWGTRLKAVTLYAKSAARALFPRLVSRVARNRPISGPAKSASKE